MEYDEDCELTRYVWNHYQPLMTEFERRVGHAALRRAKFAAVESLGVASSTKSSSSQ